ncbi:MAG: FAD-dependent oxidoreductase [bacterium]
MPEVVILGAGLTGLSAAYHLEKSSFFDYAIYEKCDRPGGLLRSFSQDDFTFDFTGHLLHINNPDMRAFISNVLGFENLQISHRNSAIYSHNTHTNFPYQMHLYGLPEKVIYECLDGFINRKTHYKKPQNFYDWVHKYFGAGFGKHFFFPYNSKILAYPVKKIHPSWTGRFVPQTTLKAIIHGALRQKSEQNIGYNSSFYYPKTGGIETLIKNIITKLKTKIKTKHEAIKIDLENKKIYFSNGHTETYKYLITTIPLNELLQKTHNSASTLLQNTAHKLLCTSVINFNLGFAQKHISDRHWIYYPEKQTPFYRIGFWDQISQSSVQKNCSAIYGETSYLAGTKTDTQINNLLEKSIRKSLDILAIHKSKIITQKILHLKHAYVIYDAWRDKNITKIHQTLSKKNIYSIGRFGAWRYSSMQEDILDGQNTTNHILLSLNYKKYKHHDFGSQRGTIAP